MKKRKETTIRGLEVCVLGGWSTYLWESSISNGVNIIEVNTRKTHTAPGTPLLLGFVGGATSLLEKEKRKATKEKLAGIK